MITTQMRDSGVLMSKAKLQYMIGCTDCVNAAPAFIQGMFFDAAPTTFGAILKRWTGTEWIKAKLRVYRSGFIAKTLKVYKAGSWQNVDTL